MAMLLWTACGSDPTDRGPVGFTVSPATATAEPGARVTLTASASGALPTDLEWIAERGSVKGEGTSVVFVAPEEIGTYVVSVRSRSQPSMASSTTVSVEIQRLLDPDAGTAIDVNQGAASVRVAPGSVEATTSIRIRSSDASDLPASAGAAILVVDVQGEARPDHPMGVAFRLPLATSGTNDAADEPYQVWARAEEGAPWTLMPSWYADGEVHALVPAYSTVALARGERASESSSGRVADFSLATHGIRFDNSPDAVSAVMRDHAKTIPALDQRWNGLCWGFAAASLDYYLAKRSPPESRSVANDATFGANVAPPKHYHSDALARYILSRHTDQRGHKFAWLFDDSKLLFGSLDNHNLAQAHDLYERLSGPNPKPTLLSFRGTYQANGKTVTYGHSVLAYATHYRYDRASDTLRYTFDVYDPNNYVGVIANAHTISPQRV